MPEAHNRIIACACAYVGLCICAPNVAIEIAAFVFGLILAIIIIVGPACYLVSL